MFKSVIRGVMQALAGGLAVYGFSAEDSAQITALVEPLLLSAVALYWSWVDRGEPARINNTFVEPADPADDVPPPKGYWLSSRSLGVLSKVDKRLQDVFRVAIVNSPHDFTIYHGLRTAQEQAEMVAGGKSWVQRSKHQDGLAVDIYIIAKDGGADWTSAYKYEAVARHVQDVARSLGVSITWGGDWRVRDYTHFEIA